MKRPTAAHLKKVTAENLAGLGAERLAEILVDVADTRVDLKRRLRMELAPGLGAAHQTPEIDKRLATLQTSRGAVTWRQKPAVLRDLDALRGLIADRLGTLEPGPALERLWRFMATAKTVAARFSDDDEAVDAIYRRAAGDVGRLLATADAQMTANTLIEAAGANPRGWARWLPALLAHTAPAIAQIGLRQFQERSPSPG